MALIQCPECGNQVSSTAVSCPHCGAPIAGSQEAQAAGAALTTTQQTSKRLKLHYLGATAIFLVGIVWLFTGMSMQNENPGMEIDLGTPFIVTIAGLSWFLITKFRIWWHHK